MSHSGQILRLFFGVPVPAPLLAGLSGLRAGARPGWRWLHPDDYHVTVAFLGNIDGTQLPALTALGDRVAAATPPGELSLSALEWWPDRRRPRLLVATGAPGPLAALHAAMLDGLRALSVAVDERPLRPHVTLARLRPESVDHDCTLPGMAVTLPVAELVLYQSRRETAGARYRPLWRQPLAGLG